MAALYLGAKIASLDPSLSTSDCTHLLNLVKPKLIFCNIESVNNLIKALEDAKLESKIIVFGEMEGFMPFSDFLLPTGTENDFEATTVDINETAVIFFSSGTTGLPKGICNTHYGLLSKAYTREDMLM